MQRDHIGLRQRVFQRVGRHGRAERETRADVVEHHAHAHGFSQDANLRADIAVADHGHGLATNLERTLGGFLPFPQMGRAAFLGDAAHQHDRLADHQFRHRARVGERGIEHRNAGVGRRAEVDLRGADAEAAHRQQLAGLGEGFRRERGGGADAKQFVPLHRLLQGFAGQGLALRGDVDLMAPQHLLGAGVDIF
ncbi:hypothetical protein D3C86_1615760 [compost metagenome]